MPSSSIDSGRGTQLSFWQTGLARRAWAWAVIVPPLSFFLVFFVGPLLYLFVISFLEPSQTELYGSRTTVENYVAVLTDPFYLKIIYRTLKAGLIILGTCLLLGYPAAYAIAQMKPRGRILCLMVLLFPLMVSNVIRAYGWIAILGRQGVVNTVLGGMGLIDFPLRMLYSFGAVVFGLLTILLPFIIISIANSLMAIDRTYKEAAQALGAGPVRTFLHVTLPLSSPGVATGMLLVLFLTLSAYVTISLLGGARFKLLVSMVFDTANLLEWPRAAALSFILLAVALTAGALILAIVRPTRVRGGK